MRSHILVSVDISIDSDDLNELEWAIVAILYKSRYIPNYLKISCFKDTIFSSYM
jgi:hypothetical protein